MNIKQGYCHCGCNGKTSLAPATNSKRRWIKGQPVMFIHNHHCRGINHFGWNGGKTKKDQYVMVLVAPGNYEYEHRVIAEKTFGRALPLGTIVHHYGSYDNKDKGCLVICENHSYHTHIHARWRALRESGHAKWRKCKYCHKYDDPKTLYIPPNNKYAMHRGCNAKYHRDRKKRIKDEHTNDS